MRVLMITGDRRFGPGHVRYELQKGAVEALGVMYWGRGSYFPRIPAGPASGIQDWDVVTVQDPFFRGLFARHVAHKLKARLNVQVHADLSEQSALKRLVARFVLRHAGSVRVVSEKLKGQVERMGAKARVIVLPVFIDIAKFRALAPQPHAQKTILWIGRLEAEKDPLLAVEVLRRVRAEVDAKLMFLGAGSLEAKLREAAKGLPVEFAGWGDPARYLPVSDVVLSTSRHESYGASILEALAAGVPVVAPDVGIAREAGAVVVPREQLVQAVVDVLRSNARGALQLPLSSRGDWIRIWKESL